MVLLSTIWVAELMRGSWLWWCKQERKHSRTDRHVGSSTLDTHQPTIYSSTHLPIHLLIYPSIYSSTHLLIHLLIYSSIYSSTHSSNPSTHLSIHLLIYSSTHPSTHLLIHLPTQWRCSHTVASACPGPPAATARSSLCGQLALISESKSYETTGYTIMISIWTLGWEWKHPSLVPSIHSCMPASID